MAGPAIINNKMFFKGIELKMAIHRKIKAKVKCISQVGNRFSEKNMTISKTDKEIWMYLEAKEILLASFKTVFVQ